jgi:6,7-dimethyl-8-ribityllumazine synthase
MLTAHSLENIPQLGPARIHVLKSKWHGEACDSLTEKFLEVMKRAGCEEIPVHTVSGSLEMPLAAQDLIEAYPDIEAVVCFGIILKGETMHFEMMLQTLSTAFAKLTLEKRTPLINCIIPATKEGQVTARAGNDGKNKGIEAALATIETVLWRRSLHEGKR